MGKLAIQLGKLGSAIGILAGLIEMSIGAQIRPWIGNKENPAVLGVITFFLSAIAFLSVLSARNHAKTTNDRKLTIFLGVLLPAAICFTTVGRLWYLPGSLLIVTCLILGYEYWFSPAAVRSPKIISRKFWVNQIMGGVGSLIILVSVILAFFNSNYGLFESEIILKADHFRFAVLPMDIVRFTNLSGGVTIVEDIEVGLVMIVYIFLILGAAIALISSLAQSQLFKGIGGIIVFTGLALFLFCLPGILAILGSPSVRFQNIIGSLGLGWYLSAVGMSLIIISSLLKIKELMQRVEL